jgi:glycosyltransferase involved in cell wall biosynthesis
MLCECVPVGTAVAGIPNAIGPTGFIVPVGDPKAAADAISRALRSDNGKLARDRIVSMYSADKRERALVELIRKLIP